MIATDTKKQTTQEGFATSELLAKAGKTFDGIVVKSAMQDTITVSVERYVKHPKYKKYQRFSKKYLVHNPGNSVSVGDRVKIRETRPISKRKHFIISSHIAKSEAVEE